MAEGTRPTISTHVLDTERGLPAEGVRVTLSRLDVGSAPIRMTQALTDGDGRIADLLERPLAEERHQMFQSRNNRLRRNRKLVFHAVRIEDEMGE